jgi:hypothetical protein
MVRGVGPPPYFTGKNMLEICMERVRSSPRLDQILKMLSKQSYFGYERTTIQYQIGKHKERALDL